MEGVILSEQELREHFIPDMNEALIKKTAMAQCRKSFLLSDHTKFGNVSSVTFAPFQGVTILTDSMPEEYKDCKNIIRCEK